MPTQNSKPLMDQKIFSLGLSVNTVSLYLLMTGLKDSGMDLTKDAMSQVFNGTRDELDEGLADLAGKGIIVKDDDSVYQVEPADKWK